MRLAARVDENQARIVAELRALGAWVWPLHQIGHGFPDLLVAWRGHLCLLEVKTKGGKLTKDEAAWHARYPGVVSVVYSLEDALAAIGAVVE